MDSLTDAYSQRGDVKRIVYSIHNPEVGHVVYVVEHNSAFTFTWLAWEKLTREFYAEKLTRSAQPFTLFFALFFPFLPLDLYK